MISSKIVPRAGLSRCVDPRRRCMGRPCSGVSRVPGSRPVGCHQQVREFFLYQLPQGVYYEVQLSVLLTLFCSGVSQTLTRRLFGCGIASTSRMPWTSLHHSCDPKGLTQVEFFNPCVVDNINTGSRHDDRAPQLASSFWETVPFTEALVCTTELRCRGLSKIHSTSAFLRRLPVTETRDDRPSFVDNSTQRTVCWSSRCIIPVFAGHPSLFCSDSVPPCSTDQGRRGSAFRG